VGNAWVRARDAYTLRATLPTLRTAAYATACLRAAYRADYALACCSRCFPCAHTGSVNLPRAATTADNTFLVRHFFALRARHRAYRAARGVSRATDRPRMYAGRDSGTPSAAAAWVATTIRCSCCLPLLFGAAFRIASPSVAHRRFVDGCIQF